MKLKLERIFYFLLIAQIISTQGIITFNIFKLFGNWELKSIVHPVSVFLLFITVAFYRFNKRTIKMQPIDLLLLSYFFICFIILIYNLNSFSKIYIAFREVFLISLLIFAYQQFNISHYYWRKILKLLYILVIVNLAFVLLTHIIGPEEYMKLLTGRYVWATDPDYKFKISSFLYFWRSPGVIGSPGNVGYFGLITYLLFDQDAKYKKKPYLAILLAIVGFVRSVYVVLVVYWMLKFLLTKKNLKIIKLGLPYIFSFLILLFCFLYFKGALDLTSLFMRIDHWVNDITVDFNILFGGGIGEVGGAVRGEGFIATLDSYWLLMLISVGLVGVILQSAFMYEKVLNNQKTVYALVGFLFAGLFITLTQGISFLVLFPLLFFKKSESVLNE
tara:strand:+ start:1606 stop:2769 length:1164 start_codon:yes stop_codon:yes gene_type:complete